MTIEEKAKAYDEAIERARKEYKNHESFLGFCEMLVHIFPELKESEDEKIKSAAIEFVRQNKSFNYCLGISKEEVIAWLEKQGRHAKFINGIQVGDKVTRNEDGVLVNLSQLKRVAKPTEEYNITGIGSKNAQGKLGEMIKNLKPVNLVLELDSAWSEKYIADVFEKVGLAKIAREQSNDSLTNALQDAMIELSKFTPQPKQEWSEENESRIDNLCHFLEEYGNQYYGHLTLQETISWLKSLKERVQPQKTWKPSDEQMNALNYVVNLMASSERPTENDLYYNILKSLRQQLVKLKG